MGATQAAAGVLAPFIEARHGGALLELTARSLDLFDALLGRLTADSGQAVGYQRTGTLEVATLHENLRDLEALRDTLVARGVAVELLDRSTVLAREPHLARDILGGLM